MRCASITNAGTRCKRNAVDGTDRCAIPVHQADAEPKTLEDIAEAGDRRATLRAMRRRVAQEIDTSPAPRDLKALMLEMRKILAELDALGTTEPVKREAAPPDELERIRAARAERARTAGGAPSA